MSLAWRHLQGVQRSEAAQNYANVVLADGPVGYWRMNATSGTTQADASGNARTATIVGGVTLGQPGAITDGDTSMLLDGSTGDLTVGSGLTVTGACTFEAWLYDTSGVLSDYKGILVLQTGTNALLMSSGKKAQCSLNLSSGQKNVQSTSVLAANRWNHVVGTFDGADVITVYINGAMDKQTAGLAGTLVTGGTTRFLGSDDAVTTARFWQGRLDEVALYNKLLTPAQVATHYVAALL